MVLWKARQPETKLLLGHRGFILGRRLLDTVVELRGGRWYLVFGILYLISGHLGFILELRGGRWVVSPWQERSSIKSNLSYADC